MLPARLRLVALAASLAALLPAAAAAGALSDAEAALQLGDVGSALRLSFAATRDDADNVAAHELYIDLMLGTNQAAAVLERYQRLARERPGQPDFLYLLGRATPDPTASEAAFREALHHDPSHARAWTGLAAVQRGQGKAEDAALTYRKALSFDSDLSEAWAGLRAISMMRNDGAGLAAVSLEAVEAAPQDPQSWLAAAATNPGQAGDLLDRALRIHPSQPELILARARAAFEDKDWDLAARVYQTALDQGADQVPGIRVEAALVQELRSGAIGLDSATTLLRIRDSKDPGEALNALDAIVAKWPHSGWAHLVRGNLRSARGMAPQAEEDLRAAITRMPSTPEAWSALGSFLLGTGRSAEARPLLQKAASARATDPALAVAAAVAAAQAGDLLTSEKELLDAMGRFPRSPGPPMGLARLYLSVGKKDAAFGVLTQALAKNPELNLALALVSAAREAGRPEDAVAILDQLATQTGDPRLRKAADGLRSAQAAQPE